MNDEACLVLSVFQINELEDKAYKEGYEDCLKELSKLFKENPDRLKQRLTET